MAFPSIEEDGDSMIFARWEKKFRPISYVVKNTILTQHDSKSAASCKIRRDNIGVALVSYLEPRQSRLKPITNQEGQ